MAKNTNPSNNSFYNIIHFIHSHVLYLNNSKFFAGVIMILLNVGAKFIPIQFSKSTEEYLKWSVTKQVLVFAMAWMGTRDIYASLMLTAAFTILSEHLFNEESEYCIVPEKYRILSKIVDTNEDGKVSKDEINNAIAILEKAKKENYKNKQKETFASYHSYLQDSYKNLT
jgi:hypothetical protein